MDDFPPGDINIFLPHPRGLREVDQKTSESARFKGRRKLALISPGISPSANNNCLHLELMSLLCRVTKQFVLILQLPQQCGSRRSLSSERGKLVSSRRRTFKPRGGETYATSLDTVYQNFREIDEVFNDCCLCSCFLCTSTGHRVNH